MKETKTKTYKPEDTQKKNGANIKKDDKAIVRPPEGTRIEGVHKATICARKIMIPNIKIHQTKTHNATIATAEKNVIIIIEKSYHNSEY